MRGSARGSDSPRVGGRGDNVKIGSFADLQAKLDALQGNLASKRRSTVGDSRRSSALKPSSSRPNVASAMTRDRRVSSRGGTVLQWQGTRSYQDSRHGV